jgi:hypothetical protein
MSKVIVLGLARMMNALLEEASSASLFFHSRPRGIEAHGTS